MRERDERGRFVRKTEAAQQLRNDENDFHHQVLRTYNRLADGGKEPTLQEVRKECRLQQASLRCLAAIFALFLLWLLLTGCRAQKHVEYYPYPVEKVVTKTVTVKDTLIEVQLVPYRDSITTPDTTSYLQNPYAESRATVSGGLLRHSLNIKPGVKAKDTLQTITIVQHDSIPYPQPVPGPVQYIERPLSGIEKVLMFFGVVAVVTLLVGVGAWIKDITRKP